MPHCAILGDSLAEGVAMFRPHCRTDTPRQAEAADPSRAGFKTLKTAYATIKGFEVMRALRKGQASAFNVSGDIRGEARIVERAFGLGASALAEVVSLLNNRLQAETA